ncbi:MAG: hypothetical protein ACRDHZ_24315 [Ktedonobacteraceae bacterium]
METSDKVDFPPRASVALIDGVGYFHSTHADEESARRTAEACGGRIKPFGVHIKEINRSNRRAINWEKTEGFSVWV